MGIKCDLQMFGGRGSMSGIRGNIVVFAQRKAELTSNKDKWNYSGERERVDKLINNANKAKTVNEINRAALSLKKEDEHITTLLRNAEADSGDIGTLMTLRRRIREQRRKTRL